MVHDRTHRYQEGVVQIPVGYKSTRLDLSLETGFEMTMGSACFGGLAKLYKYQVYRQYGSVQYVDCSVLLNQAAT